MKKIYKVFCIGAFMVPAMLFAQKPEVTVKRSSSIIEIDGAGTDNAWSNAPKIAIAKPYAGETVEGASATFQMLYDDENLYVFVDVKDDKITVDTDADWKGDKVEIYFALPGYVPGVGASGEHARQFFGVASQDWADGTTPAHWTGYSKDNWPGIASRETDGVSIGYIETVDGYAYEFKINKSALEDVDFATVDSLGLDFTLADNDVDGAGKGVRNRLVYYNSGDLQYKNENWGAMDVATLKFEKSATNNSLFMVKKTPSELIIDGMADETEWKDVAKTAIAKPYAGETVVGGSATFQMLYDTDNLYVFVDVKDDKITVDTDADWKGDKVEIYFGLPGYVPGVGASGEHARQFFGVASQEWADGTTPAHWTGYSKDGWPGIASRETDGVSIGYNETVDGYAYEFKINKSALEDVDFATIDSLGFDFTLADNDVDGAGKGVRNRLVYYNSGDLQYANENWGAMDVVGMGFDKTNSAAITKTSNQFAYIAHDVLRFKGYSSAVDVEVYSILGQKVLSAKNINQMDVSSLRNGIYMVRVNNGNQAFKVVK